MLLMIPGFRKRNAPSGLRFGALFAESRDPLKKSIPSTDLINPLIANFAAGYVSDWLEQ